MSKNLTITENLGEGLRQLRGKALWAALATLIDAEGCISLDKQSKLTGQYTPVIKVGNVSKDWMIAWQTRVGRGRIQDGEQAENSKQVFRWIIGKKADVVYILKRIRPYLFVKVQQADTLLDFIEKKEIYGKGCKIPKEELLWRDECWQRMRTLNAKGNPERLNVEHPGMGGVIVPSAKPFAELDANVLVH